MSIAKLSWDDKMGGLRLPNFKFYYWAAQMRYLLSLFEWDSSPSWTQIEMYDHDEEVKSDLIYKWNPKSIITKTKTPLTIHLMRSWYEVHEIIGVKVDFSPKTPLWKNKLIPIFSDNKIFKLWQDKGIMYFEQCYSNGTPMSFEQLKAKYVYNNGRVFKTKHTPIKKEVGVRPGH